MLSSARPVDWAVFTAAVIGTMLLDRVLFGRGKHRVSFREASIRSMIWIAVGVGFGAYVYFYVGPNQGLSYLIAYLVEKSLSVDNLFVFLVVFSYFGVREKEQQRVLFWGVAGAVLMRLVFILAGTALLQRFSWTMYLFGGFLVFTGVKLGLSKGEESMNPEDNFALKLARRFLRTTDKKDGEKFFTRIDGKLLATPLFLVLIAIEATDLIFAVDSVPAVLAISSDLFVVYTSNILAILGLRALYFMLSGMMGRFHYLNFGLSVILVFIGGKMVASNYFHLPNLVSLGVIVGVLTLSIVFSLLRPKPKPSIPDGA